MPDRRDILCISSIDWDFIWQGHQEIMSTFAREGHRVLYIENTGVRAPTLRDLPRLKQRAVNWWRSTKGFREVRENLFVYSPLILPFPYSRVARWINRRLLLRAIRRWMDAMGFRRPIVWTFLPTPLALDVIRDIDPELTIYYCIDDLASSSFQARKIAQWEPELFRRSDLVFVTSEKLRRRAAAHNSRVHLFPFGVAFERFRSVSGLREEPPAELKSAARPVIGYIGGIRKEIDQELLGEVASRMPEATFVMVGPLQTDISRLACSNMMFLGQRRHEELPRYIRQFNVGIIPYLLNDYTEHIYPSKLNEYLAVGIPVVTTDLPEIRRINAESGEIVAIARDADEFVSAIRDALKRESPERSQRRIAVAEQNSWSAKISRMSELIDARLRERGPVHQGWEKSLQRIYRTARKRVTLVAGWLLAVSLVLFHSPFLWWVASPLRLSAPARPADAIVVFGGGVGESGKAGGGYEERVWQAVHLYKQGYAPRILFSSGYTFFFREVEVMRDLAIAQGVPESAILVQTQVASTRDHVLHVSSMLQQGGWRSVLLISSPYHMRRALLTWHKLAPTVQVIPSPVAESQFYAPRWGASLEEIRGILHEYIAMVVYAWKGWI